ncbi:plasmid recombination protein [Methylophilus sp. 5]|uniref:plasmid recombination protein n=1 Tax=Methylophilus sp. 5 TaxID=1112274 RepID=UPI0004918677|nr:plasmid recombination protein [Methylophilus sp. 5]
MASSHLIKLKSKSGKHGVLAASKHNKRELPPDAHIDVSRTPLNYCLAGNDTPANIATHAKVQMLKAGIETPRKNGVMAVEVIFSLPIERHQQDTKQFFMDCYHWTLKTFVGEVLSFDIHLDESAPHAHALILPLVDGKMQGNKMIGNTGNLMRLINLFHAEVAHRYGLSKSDRKRLTITDRQALEREVLTRLKADVVMQSSVWACVRDAIHKDPLPWAQTLSISLQKTTSAKVKSFVDHKRSKGKGSFKR